MRILTNSGMRMSIVGGFAVFMALAAIGNAQEVSGTMDEMSDESRYQLKQKGDVFIRLDRKNGQMSVCRLDRENLVCRMAADDRDAFVDELDSLQERIARLEENANDEVAQLPKPRKRKRAPEDDGFPLDEEIDEAMEYSGKVIRKFFDVMKELREDLNE